MNRFVKPNPQRWLINATSFLNRTVVLPYFCNISNIHYDGVSLEEISKLVCAEPVFFAPNHPEFFSDWMLDAEIMSIVAPDSAKWANHLLVNSAIQPFWLAHNLIARVPNNEVAKNEAFDYAVQCAQNRKGVLLHPEGKVTWCRNNVRELHDGVIRMSIKASDVDVSKKSYVVPIVWKHYFDDIENSYLRTRKALMKLIDELEIHFGNANSHSEIIPQRLILKRIYLELLKRDAKLLKIDLDDDNHRTNSLVIVNECISKINEDSPTIFPTIVCEEDYTFSLRRRLLQYADGSKDKLSFIKCIDRTLRMNFNWYSLENVNGNDEMHPEDVAECIKRIRLDYMTSPISRFWPVYFGSRTSHVYICEPLLIKSDDDSVQKLSELHYRMNHCLRHI